MGGCASKPKVSKDDLDVKAKAPEPEPELLKEDAVVETKVPQESAEPQHEIENTVDQDQPNKRRSLSLLFDKENDDTKVSEENEKTPVEETVKQESSKAEEKNLLDNEAAKQESPLIDLEEKSAVQNENNKPAEEPTKPEKLIEENQRSEPLKQEYVEAWDTLEEKSAVQNENNKPAEEPAKLEKLIEENQRNEPLKQEYVEAKDTFSVETPNKEEPIKQEYGDAKETFSVESQNKEPIKQEPLPAGSTIEQPEAGKPSGGPEKNGSKAEKSETPIEENTNTKVVPQTEEKIVEALLTEAGSVAVQNKNITEEATPNREEKNQTEVNLASKATDASSVKT